MQRAFGHVSLKTNMLRIVVNEQGNPKSKPLPNYQQISLNRIKACQWD